MRNSIKILSIIAASSLSSISLMAQEPTVEWQKSFGGSQIEDAYDMQTTADGGYILVGRSKSNDGDVTGNHGGYDFWMVKTNANGSIDWQKSYGGSSDDIAYSIQQTSDGGYIAAGYSESGDGDVTLNQGDMDYWVVKTDPNGNIDWQKSYGGDNSDAAYSIQQTSDGGYVLIGYSKSKTGDVTGNHDESDYWVVKIEANGNIDWQKCYGGSAFDLARIIQQTNDGGYIFAGYCLSDDGDVTGNHGGYDYWVVKTDANGGIEWQKSYGGSVTDIPNSIQQTLDGGYIIAGRSGSIDGDITGNHGENDYWVVKTKANGSIEWQRTYGGSSDDVANSIQQTSDSGFIVAGMTQSIDGDVSGNHGSDDYWIVKVGSSGSIQWEKTMGGSENEGASAIHPTADYGYIIAGHAESNNDDVSDNYGSYDFWLVKLEGAPSGIEEAFAEKIIIYPIPAHDLLCFSERLQDIRIYSIAGAAIARFESETHLDLRHLSSGSYTLKAKTMDGKSITRKFIKK